jgi:cobalamin biosynthesis Mg chelatase CobN
MEEHEKLAAEALAATAPDPQTWVQVCQMALAVIVLVGALAAAGILILHGPPSPKAATSEVAETTKTKTGQKAETVETTRSGVVGASLTTGANTSVPSGTTGSDGTAETGSAGTTSTESATGGSGSEEGESLANLSKQGPWAFAIVALLAAVFLATGKTLNVGASKTGGGDGDGDGAPAQDGPNR